MPRMTKWYLVVLALAVIAAGVFFVWFLASSRTTQPGNAQLVSVKPASVFCLEKGTAETARGYAI